MPKWLYIIFTALFILAGAFLESYYAPDTGYDTITILFAAIAILAKPKQWVTTTEFMG